jgi:hypothetical protein
MGRISFITRNKQVRTGIGDWSVESVVSVLSSVESSIKSSTSISPAGAARAGGGGPPGPVSYSAPTPYKPSPK